MDEETRAEIDSLGKQATDLDSPHRVSSVGDDQILGLRSEQNLDELSASEPSDGEVEAENMVTFFRYKSHPRNRLHLPDALTPSVTACIPHKHKTPIQIRDLVPHSLKDEELEAITSRDPDSGPRLCVACVTARPDRFPEAVVRAHVRAPSP